MQQKDIEGVLVLTVEMPRIDAAAAVKFHEEASALVNGHGKVVLDLGGVEFMDSAGVGALVGVAKRMEKGGKAAVANLSPAVRSLFTLLRMDKLFAVHASVDDAVRHFAQ